MLKLQLFISSLQFDFRLESRVTAGAKKLNAWLLGFIPSHGHNRSNKKLVFTFNKWFYSHLSNYLKINEERFGLVCPAVVSLVHH